MAEEIELRGELYQEDAASQIRLLFGPAFIYTSENGNDAISREVLKEFRQLTPHVIWDSSERYWRKQSFSRDEAALIEQTLENSQVLRAAEPLIDVSQLRTSLHAGAALDAEQMRFLARVFRGVADANPQMPQYRQLADKLISRADR